jgi:hypothetical protein
LITPPWSVEEQAACFIVRDANGQALAYVYFEEEPGRRSSAKLLTKDEARRGEYRQAAGIVADPRTREAFSSSSALKRRFCDNGTDRSVRQKKTPPQRGSGGSEPDDHKSLPPIAGTLKSIL